MGDPATYAHWVELDLLLKEKYPNISQHEAYKKLVDESEAVKFIDQAATRCCEDLKQAVADANPDCVTEALGGILWVTGKCLNQPGIQKAGELLYGSRLVSQAISKVQQLWNPKIIEATVAGPSHVTPLSTEAAAASVSLSKTGGSISASPAQTVVQPCNGVDIINNSLVDHINYYGRWQLGIAAVQLAQGERVIKKLKSIERELGESNSLTVSGATGPDGFAQPVYDFIVRCINKAHGGDRRKLDNHRFFVFHPGTTWYGAFERLISRNPLPPQFCAKSDNLDKICQFMQEYRESLIRKSDHAKELVFHLLMPTWYHTSYPEPLHFPECLYPLHVEGETYKDKDLVTLNLPAAPDGLLVDVSNVTDPNNWCQIAQTISGISTAVTMGWGVNGACLAAGVGAGILTGLGPFIMIPVWAGGFATLGMKLGPKVDRFMEENVYYNLCEQDPRILGSTARFHIRRWQRH
ncbi:uncharacterized protein KD926_008973 [Aspergillus affinis]|uniref:uncharacterized protein n=1 Tax=Aspergillus affinis TaxID=1070780 RepID=UPI0022FDEDA0|nr:uncharacterized protein KD926_008973 [Aspergillus affinis]KAI9039872.1 hypothetical protein KD926_008973 [Aspergillus affinis]